MGANRCTIVGNTAVVASMLMCHRFNGENAHFTAVLSDRNVTQRIHGAGVKQPLEGDRQIPAQNEAADERRLACF